MSVATGGGKRSQRSTRADGEQTRARILEAAGTLFAGAGYADTTSKTVAAAAGVDLASINYHYGSRSGLYQAVLVEAHRRVVNVDDLQQLLGSSPAPADMLRWFITRLVDTAQDQSSWHTRIFARELLAPSANLQALYEVDLQPKLAVVLQMFSAISGLPVGDPALLRCMISVAAPCMLLLVAGGGGVPGPAQAVAGMPREVLVEHFHRFALAGLQAVGRADPPHHLLVQPAGEP